MELCSMSLANQNNNNAAEKRLEALGQEFTSVLLTRNTLDVAIRIHANIS
jgi:hypothetical protein